MINAAIPQINMQSTLDVQQVNETNKVGKVAQDFEALFVTELFKSMRRTVMKSGESGEQNFAQETFEHIFDEQLAQHIAQSGAFGIGRILEKELLQEHTQVMPNLADNK